MARPGGRFVRRLDWALSTFPLTTRVVLTHVVEASRTADGRVLRWLAQAVIMSWRLPPRFRDELDTVLRDRFGPDASPIDAVRAAAQHDRAAARWLDDIEEHGASDWYRMPPIEE